MSKDRPKITGTAGTRPPPGAPYEVGDASTGVSAQQALLRARGGHEKELAPFNPSAHPQITPGVVLAAPVRAVVVSVDTAGSSPSVSPPPVVVDNGGSTVPSSDLQTTPPVPPADPVSSPASSAVVVAPAGVEGAGSSPVVEESTPPPSFSAPAAPAEAYQPAASNTDSPSRGVPQPIADANKQISGGFGDVLEAQYFPLDGSELKALIEALLDDCYVRIQHDLRFSMAATYPRVRARVEVIVEGWAEDQSQAIVVHAKPHERTPIDVARAKADEICFVVVSAREEFDAAGNVSSSPNAIRQELGLTAPQKQRVNTPGGPMIVDVVG